jgi:hypothetical protein
LPESVLPVCYVRVSVNGSPVSIAVGDTGEAPGSPCRHPLKLSRQDLLQLDRGGRIPIAIMSFGIGIASVAYVDVLAGDVFRVGLQQQSEFGCSGRRVEVCRGSSGASRALR